MNCLLLNGASIEYDLYLFIILSNFSEFTMENLYCLYDFVFSDSFEIVNIFILLISKNFNQFPYHYF